MTIVVQSGVLRSVGGNTTAGLVSYWPFNETSGFNADDPTGNHDATVTNDTLWDTGSTSYEFTPSLGNASVTSHSAFNTGTALTVCAWIKASAASNVTVFGKNDSGATERAWFLGTVTTGSFNKLRFLVNGDGTSGTNYLLEGSQTAFDNTWHHVAARFGSSFIDTFVDGVKDPSPTRTGSAISTIGYYSDVPLSFGCLVAANTVVSGELTGFAKKFRFYNTAKTDADILAIYNLGQ